MSADLIVRISSASCLVLEANMCTSARNAFLLGRLAAAMFAAISAASAQDPGAQTPRPLATPSQTVRTAASIAGAHLPALNSTRNQVPRILMIHGSPPHLIKQGPLIKIPQGSPLRSKLSISAVAAKEIERRLTLTAVVEADPSRTVQVLAPVPGVVVDVKIQLGDRVAPDQELALVYAGVAQANSDDRRAQSTIALPNQLTASDPQTGPQSNLSGAANDCHRAGAELLRSTTRLCALIMSAEGLEDRRLFSLRAPVAGSVINVGIRPGLKLDDPSSSILTIADLDRIWVTAGLRKKDMALIAPERPAEIAFIAYPNEVFMGEARFTGDTLDSSSFKIRIELPNSSRRLKPNMSAVATLLGPNETVPVIPTTALIRKNERDWVFVEVEQCTFEARPVKVGFPVHDNTVVVSGLNIGERIVVMGGALLED
jgi:cobalt-zinc-cadmium efflux system membrane fusion protein